MKKNTKWILENKTNYEKIFEDKREKKLDFIIEDLIENRNLSLDTNFDFKYPLIILSPASFPTASFAQLETLSLN